jgi:hypothetical protein
MKNKTILKIFDIFDEQVGCLRQLGLLLKRFVFLRTLHILENLLRRFTLDNLTYFKNVLFFSLQAYYTKLLIRLCTVKILKWLTIIITKILTF